MRLSATLVVKVEQWNNLDHSALNCLTNHHWWLWIGMVDQPLPHPWLAEKQQGPAHFADLISSLQATEQDCEPRISVSLTSQPQIGGPASSADLTSSVPAANEACELPVNITSHFQVVDKSPQPAIFVPQTT